MSYVLLPSNSVKLKVPKGTNWGKFFAGPYAFFELAPEGKDASSEIHVGSTQALKYYDSEAMFAMP